MFCGNCGNKTIKDKNNQNNNKSSSIFKTILKILKNGLRILLMLCLLLFILVYLLDSNWFSICFVLCFILLIPRIADLLYKKFKINRIIKYIAIVLLFIVGLVNITPVSETSNGNSSIDDKNIKENEAVNNDNKDDSNDKVNKKEDTEKQTAKSDYSNIKGLNKKQKQNFITALKECNIEPSKVKSLKKTSDWSNGSRYSFTYKGDTLWLYMYEDNTVSSINLSLTGLHLYDEKYESLNYENYYISSANASLMQIRAEEQVGIYLKDESSAKYNWNSYQRTNEYFAISGNVEANNSFGQKVKSTAYVEFKLQDNSLQIVYIETNGTRMYGTKVVPQINRVERKNSDKSSETSITLKDGVLGNFGKYDTMDGKQYIRYYIPTGKYKATALVKNSMFYVESIAIHKENGYDTPTTYNTITLKKKSDSQTIEITDGQCISLVIGTRIKLEKIN